MFVETKRERERERKCSKSFGSFAMRVPSSSLLFLQHFFRRRDDDQRIHMINFYEYLSINSLINGFTSAGFSSIGQ